MYIINYSTSLYKKAHKKLSIYINKNYTKWENLQKVSLRASGNRI
jgi:hypothetical protein